MATIADYSTYTCDQSLCTVSTTGKCLKGINPPSSCTFITNDHDMADEDLEEADEEEDTDATEDSDLLDAHDADDLDEDDSEEETDKVPPVNDSIYFADGEALPEASIQTITYAFPTKLILIIGGPDCGKTTLIAAISEAFQKAPLGGYLFASSRTLVGFERRSYLARRDADRAKPATLRTISKEFSHLHLAIREESLASKAKHLLFTDVSGELFKAAYSTDADMQSLIVLKKADHIFYMVDGEALSSPAKRFKAQSDINHFLRRGIQNNLLTEENKIIILINKYDRVQAAHAEEELELFFTTPLRNTFSSIIADVQPTIARPSSGSPTKEPLNLETVIRLCVQNRECHTELSYNQSSDDYLREFTRLFSE